MRVGVGYDSHRFATGGHRKLMLGGVEIPFERGLEGWSDADVVVHALTDAILGAASLGDIGRLFPPDDPQWRDADSIVLLGKALERVSGAGMRCVQCDVTVVTERPKLAPFADRMQGRLASALGIASDHVSIKAKTNEGMGWIGRGEGIAAIAVALLEARA